jgi:hypothetical protein
MTVTGMATADYNTVSSALECAKYKHRINSAGAGNTNDLYVCGICKTVVSCEIGACIRAPVAAKCNY